MGNAAAMPAFPAAPSATPTIKLLIAKDAGVVLLAEAGKDVVDFLLGLLAMPLAAVIKLSGKEKDSPLGALATLYASVERMDAGYMQSPETRDALLNPAPAHPALVAAAGGFPSLVQPAGPPPPAPVVPAPPGPSKAPPCFSSLKGLAALPPFNVGSSGACHCDACLAAQAQGSKGFVRGLVTYTVTDELAVTPMSNISSIALLHRLGVEDLGALEERTVKIGYQEKYLRDTLLNPTSAAPLQPSLFDAVLYRFHVCYCLRAPTGFVRAGLTTTTTYTVVDDLTVTPTSNVSTVALLNRLGVDLWTDFSSSIKNRLGVKDFGTLEERTYGQGRPRRREDIYDKFMVCALFVVVLFY
ncbi:hypothetical protein BAE44_0026250 [Dichanthelium oligosanthes]|uniref:DUF674 domain-containing protein n=1 Tax=Dichanthelium oligosanthes TaxID=888268 RepID=A0A1E5UIN6_9POAL|nr:hypothetical protein BAE44_0026250 [Dichanthelium oligosanthes]